MSSADLRAETKWSAPLGDLSHHTEEDEGVHGLLGFSYVYRSRVTYIDGKEAFVTYVQRGKPIAEPERGSPYGNEFDVPWHSHGSLHHGDHYIIDTENPDERSYFNTDYFDISLGGAPVISRTAMEDAYTDIMPVGGVKLQMRQVRD